MYRRSVQFVMLVIIAADEVMQRLSIDSTVQCVQCRVYNRVCW